MAFELLAAVADPGEIEVGARTLNNVKSTGVTLWRPTIRDGNW